MRVAVGEVSGFPVGRMRVVKVEGLEILVARVKSEEFYAVDVMCTHALGYLDEGELVEYEVICPLHSGAFDLRTGLPIAGPPDMPLQCYPVEVEHDIVYVCSGGKD